MSILFPPENAPAQKSVVRTALERLEKIEADYEADAITEAAFLDDCSDAENRLAKAEPVSVSDLAALLEWSARKLQENGFPNEAGAAVVRNCATFTTRAKQAAPSIRAALDRVARNDAWYDDAPASEENDKLHNIECMAAQEALRIATATNVTDVAACLDWCCHKLEENELSAAELVALGKCRDFMKKRAGF